MFYDLITDHSTQNILDRMSLNHIQESEAILTGETCFTMSLIWDMRPAFTTPNDKFCDGCPVDRSITHRLICHNFSL